MKLCHVSISVRSLEESLQFYQDMIGLPVKSRSFVRHGLEIAFLGNSETEIELSVIRIIQIFLSDRTFPWDSRLRRLRKP